MAIANITNNILTDSGVATSALQIALNGTGFVKISGTTISYDNSTYALDSAVVKLTGTQTVGGAKTFSTYSKFDGGVILKNNVSASLAGYVGLSAYSASGNKGINIDFDTYSASFYFSGILPYQYTFPAATGTLALTSDLSSYLPLTGGTLTGALSGTSATFSSTLGIGGVADSVKSGTYTPTINTTTNIASSSVGTWQYLRVGNTVTVSGSITITPTLAVSTTSFNFSLPINSTFASGNDCAGTGVDYNATTYLMVNGNSGAANFGLGLFKSTTTSAMTLSIQFTYQII